MNSIISNDINSTDLNSYVSNNIDEIKKEYLSDKNLFVSSILNSQTHHTAIQLLITLYQYDQSIFSDISNILIDNIFRYAIKMDNHQDELLYFLEQYNNSDANFGNKVSSSALHNLFEYDNDDIFNIFMTLMKSTSFSPFIKMSTTIYVTNVMRFLLKENGNDNKANKIHKKLFQFVEMLFEKNIYPEDLQDLSVLMKDNLIPSKYMDISNTILMLNIQPFSHLFHDVDSNKDLPLRDLF